EPFLAGAFRKRDLKEEGLWIQRIRKLEITAVNKLLRRARKHQLEALKDLASGDSDCIGQAQGFAAANNVMAAALLGCARDATPQNDISNPAALCPDDTRMRSDELLQPLGLTHAQRRRNRAVLQGHSALQRPGWGMYGYYYKFRIGAPGLRMKMRLVRIDFAGDRIEHDDSPGEGMRPQHGKKIQHFQFKKKLE